MGVLEWLLDSDPAIRWQVLRDLIHAPPEEVAAERARVATEGWGARLLSLQGDDGQWAGGACFPANSLNWRQENQGQPWTSTLPTLQLLVYFGIDPVAFGSALACLSPAGRGNGADRPRSNEAGSFGFPQTLHHRGLPNIGTVGCFTKLTQILCGAGYSD
jgi:hypothetical protein